MLSSSPLNIHLITEGPSDREILKSLLSEIIGENKANYINISATQRVKTGKPALLKNAQIFSKNLHHGFAQKVDIIVVCIDNDSGTINDIGETIQEEILAKFNSFCHNNKHYSKIPCLVCAVPVVTIDYWMKAISEKNDDCTQILLNLIIPKEKIKQETYGEKNVFRETFIEQKAIQNKIKEIKSKGSLNRLRCIPSFENFENQLRDCLDRRSL